MEVAVDGCFVNLFFDVYEEYVKELIGQSINLTIAAPRRRLHFFLFRANTVNDFLVTWILLFDVKFTVTNIEIAFYI